MTESGQPPSGSPIVRWVVLIVLAVCIATGFIWWYGAPRHADTPRQVVEATPEQVHSFCGTCHAYPTPESFPRKSWRDEVEQGFAFYDTAPPDVKRQLTPPPRDAVVRYYERRAPDVLPPIEERAVPFPDSMRFVSTALPGLPGRAPRVSFVDLVHLRDNARLDLLVCDMLTGEVATTDPSAQTPQWMVLAQLKNPAHAEVVDLNRDGARDLVVADLGRFLPTDDLTGQVVWLRGQSDGSYLPTTLLTDVGRVADAQPADVDGDGDIDLIVAVFGWRSVGQILWLENRTTDWSRPAFVPHELDPRHGAIHVPVADLNGDGRPDFVALLSQEHESVVAFLNEGNGRFRRETVYTAPHPAWGSSGIQLVDFDKDGDRDVLYTNGDTLDSHGLKPFHGIRWLENRGSYPFIDHPLAAMYGVHRAVAADADADGDLDVFAVACIPALAAASRPDPSDAIILLEQTTTGRFDRHVLERDWANHFTCVAGDWEGRGRVHLVVGNFAMGVPRAGTDGWVNIWTNRSQAPRR